MTRSPYDPCLFYKFELLGIFSLQTDNNLILIEEFFAVTIKKVIIKTNNIIIKKHTYLTLQILIKLNDIFIQLALSDDIISS